MNPDLLEQLRKRFGFPADATQQTPRQPPMMGLDHPVTDPRQMPSVGAGQQGQPNMWRDPSIMRDMATGEGAFDSTNGGKTPLGVINDLANPVRWGGMANAPFHRLADEMKEGSPTLGGVAGAGLAALPILGMGGAGAEAEGAGSKLADWARNTAKADPLEQWALRNRQPMPNRGIPALHASPHWFDQFKMEKLGTGEGAQMNGQGMYLAQSPDVSGDFGFYDQKFTRRKLSSNSLEKNRLGMFRQDAELNPVSDKRLLENLRKGMSPEQAVSDDFFGNYTDGERELLKMRAEKLDAARAKLYQVNIKADPRELLDLDLPASKQPKFVREIINELHRPVDIRSAPNQPPIAHEAQNILRKLHTSLPRSNETMRIGKELDAFAKQGWIDGDWNQSLNALAASYGDDILQNLRERHGSSLGLADDAVGNKNVILDAFRNQRAEFDPLMHGEYFNKGDVRYGLTEEEKERVAELASQYATSRLSDYGTALAHHPSITTARKMAGEHQGLGTDMFESLQHALTGEHPDIGGSTGKTEQMLLDRGIPGVQYFDGAARAKQKGFKNFVIYDPARLEIMKRYGIAGATGVGGGIAGLKQMMGGSQEPDEP